MRAIDADELRKCVLKWLPQDPCGKEEKEMPFETDICVSMLMEIDEQPTIQPEPHWIPVTERLPEYGKAVLTMNKDGDYEINYIIDDEEGDFFYYGAIAWMPLPEP